MTKNVTPSVTSGLPQRLAQAYKNACLAEIEALKPGNVHIFADGHGMRVQDFMQSAEASSAVIALPELALGERIYRSVEATWGAVSCNTNLGIILLCASIIQAALLPATTNLRKRLAQVLSNTTQLDAEWTFKAIQMANPAGLGTAKAHDVNHAADCNLLEAMQASAEKDFIGLQYANGFMQIFEQGLPHYEAALSRWQRPAWATTGLYLYWLSHYPDSHIARKYGDAMAKQIQSEAIVHDEALQALENPKLYLPQLLAFDQSLKSRCINPGTSADLTVATLFIHHCNKHHCNN
jgi:triphosphoribosyl-dephospho-CoA synthase